VEGPDVKQRETVGMRRFECHSSLVITCHGNGDPMAHELMVYISLKHTTQHKPYYDVAMPAGAAAIIREHLEWTTPAEMVTKIQDEYPSVTRAQVHDAWTRMSEVLWRKDDNQMASAIKLLAEFPDEVDIFTPEGVSEGVEILCWGMRNIAGQLKGKIVEIALDATCKEHTFSMNGHLPAFIDNTNARNLELYCILGEYDNAGWPISYCLLSTASSIEIGKRKSALTAWAACVRDNYSVYPEFAHVDKDMAEIAALKALWKTNISLCWWRTNTYGSCQTVNNSI
jgi:hypothetical protein